MTQGSRTDQVSTSRYLIAVLVLLGGFPCFLAFSGISALAAMASRSPEHQVAVVRFCGAVILFLVLVCGVILGAVKNSRNAIRALIGVENVQRSGPWKTALQALVVLFCLTVVGGVSNALLAHWGSNPSAMQGMVATNNLEAGAFLLAALTAGFAEEFIFRGYLQQQFFALTKSMVAASCLQVAIFTLGHMYQGVERLLPVLLIASVLTASALWIKSLVPGMIAHGLGDGLVAIGYFIHSWKH